MFYDVLTYIIIILSYPQQCLLLKDLTKLIISTSVTGFKNIDLPTDWYR